MKPVIARCLWLIAVVFGLSASVAVAEPARLALVINQVAYQTLTPLPDTDAEARQVGNALKQVGFDVTEVRDASLPLLQASLKDFRRKLAASPGAIGFIYYTGHGMADPTDEKGDNYLLSIDADVKVVADLPASGVRLSELVNQMSRTDAAAIVIVIDACRNTPSLGKAGTKGLVAVASEPNTLVAYSTDLGDIASVGVYAPVLSREILTPGRTIAQVFERVQMDVSKQTARKQRPWSNNRIYDEICLVSCEAAPTVVQAANSPVRQLTEAQQCDARAATEYDADRPAGSGFAQIFDMTHTPGAAQEAIAACSQALKLTPGDRHLTFNLGQGYEAAGDYKQARKLYEQAATKGSAAAMYRMGVLYYLGLGVTASPAQQMRWWERSAAAGNPEAMVNLGIAYSVGEGVPMDAVKARGWLEAAAATGDVDAQAMLDGMPK